MQRLFAALALCGVLLSHRDANSQETVVNAASCSAADVQAAINAAASGQRVLLPTGSATWSTTVTIPNSKGITLDGNNATIHGRIELDQHATVTSRITGFKFTKPNAVGISGTKTSAPFRLDHNTFTTSIGGSVLVEVSGNAPGLMDHNSFNAPTNSEMIHNMGMGPTDASGWADDITPGGPNAVYIEDNTFTNNGVSGNPAYFWGNSAVQSYYGARTVFRYNYLSMSHVDQHGTPGMIGARWWEIYENTFYVVENGNQSDYVAVRGGSGVIFNNHKTGFPNLYNAGQIKLYEEDSGYPALYQIGRGKNQALDPAYVWGNDAATMPVNSGSSNVQVNRDYYLSAKPNYTPYTYPHPLTATGPSSGPIIPLARRITWEPGVPGGIPQRTTIHSNVNTNYGAVGDGVHDDAPNIQNAINACPVGQVVFIPAGTYRLNSQLTIAKGIVLRGAGPGQTFLKSYANWHALQMGDWPSAPVAANVSGSPAKDATTITLTSLGSLSLAVGDYIVIDQINDGVEVVNVDDYSRANGTRALSQMTKITAINGLTLTIGPPLYHAYSSALTPQIWKVNQNVTMTTFAGLEDLCVERVSPTGTEGLSNIKMLACAYCWVKNIESKKAQFRHVDFDRCFRNTVRDSYFNDGMHHGTGGFAYGVVCGNRATANLTENCVFNHLRHSMVIKEGAAGNVFGYNYSFAVYQGENWLATDMNAHGAHSHMNLFEGNICAKIHADFTHGSSSYNTFFRNHSTRDSSALAVTNALRAVDVEKIQYYYNFAGNILGKPGQTWTAYEDAGTRTGAQRYAYCWGYPSDGATTSTDTQSKATALLHGNFDYATQTTRWDPNNTNHTLPASLYLSSKPAWFGTLPWPAIGPDLNPLAGTIPAQARMNNRPPAIISAPTATPNPVRLR